MCFKMNSPATRRVGNGGWPAPDAHTPANRLSRNPQSISRAVASSTAFISPTRVLIEPGVTRELSVKLPQSGEQELAFRIVLQQLPEETHTNAAGTFSRITQSMPAFSEPAQPQTSKLRARRIGTQYLMITNEGGRRARLIAISSNGQIVAARLVSYALAHSSVLVPLNSPLNGSAIDIETDQGHQLVELR